MNYLFEPTPTHSLDIKNQDEKYPIHRIYCVGRNYHAHAKEMNVVAGDPTREAPFYFLKPHDALVPNGGKVPYPSHTTNFHFEMELVMAIGTECFEVSVDKALDHVFGYAVGIDLTRRDLQLKARETGRPWDTGKAVDYSAPCSEIVKVSEIGHPGSARIWLSVNDEIKQDSDIDKQIWNNAEIISHLSQLYPLQPGDLIFTGTPEGVGAINVGDKVDGGIDGVGEISIEIV